ncbi:hypothetical protein [Pseudoduganella sp. R-34]|uniref:hypothetical protein n=1 Tax=Pseudoduganella sp. R-34 TaxID=3404062 RepID=UPI003CF44495
MATTPGGAFYATKYQFDTHQHELSPTYAMNGNTVTDRTFSCWSISEPNGNDMYDFYLIQDDTSLRAAFNPTIYLDGYEFGYSLQDENGKPLSSDAAMLQDTAPVNTDPGETKSSSLSKTLSSSVGFFGNTMTGSVGTSVSMGESTSRFIPGVAVVNESLASTGNNGSFLYAVQESSASQTGLTQVCNQMLFRVRRSQAPNGVRLATTLKVLVSDHDGSHGTHYFDDFARGFGGGISVQYTNDRIGYYMLPNFTTAVISVPTAK